MQESQFLAPEIRAELEPDEKVLWVGQPNAMSDLFSTLPIFIFAVPWTAISVFFLMCAFTTTKQGQNLWFLSIIGVPFTVLGLLLLSSPFYACHLAKKFYYLATDRNLYVIQLGKQISVEKYPREDLINLVRTESGGKGTLRWTLQGNSARPSYRKAKQTGEVVFKNIANPRELEHLLRDTAKKGS
ncbi:hypothetical protein KA183_14320 [bacterium]|nr:hypothetical protein [bacterium]